jgi:hypothetical protein
MKNDLLTLFLIIFVVGSLMIANYMDNHIIKKEKEKRTQHRAKKKASHRRRRFKK